MKYLSTLLFCFLFANTIQAQLCEYTFFANDNNVGKGITGPGINADTLGLGLSIDASQTNLPNTQSWVKVIDIVGIDEMLDFKNLNGEAVVTTPKITVGQRETINVRLRVGEDGELEESDYLEMYYQLDDLPLVPLHNGLLRGDFPTDDEGKFDLLQTIDVKNKSTLRIVFKVNNDDIDEQYRLYFLYLENGSATPLFGFGQAAHTISEPTADSTVNTSIYRSHPVTTSQGADFFASQTVTVTDALSGTATAGVDYQFTPFAMTFNRANNHTFPCGTQFDIPIQIFTDDDIEGSETITLQLEFTGNYGATRITEYTLVIEETTSDALPIALVNFSAKPLTKNTILIEWETENTTTDERFILEHSYNGVDFNIINEQNSEKNNTHHYEYLHHPQQAINHFYRLTQRDFTGKTQQSAIIKTSLDVAPSFTIVNNPVTDYLIVRQLASTSTARIYNNLGQLIREFALTPNDNQLLVSDLKRGTYFLQITHPNYTKGQPFVKQ